MYIKEMVI